MSERNFRQIFFFEFKFYRSAPEMARNIGEIWGQGSVGESTVRTWFRKSKTGDFDFEDKEGRGRSSEVGNNVLKTLVEEKLHRTIRELAEELGVSKATISDHLKQTGKSKKLVKWVQHGFSENKKLSIRGVIVSSSAQQKRPVFDLIVTCDGEWILRQSVTFGSMVGS